MASDSSSSDDEVYFTDDETAFSAPTTPAPATAAFAVTTAAAPAPADFTWAQVSLGVFASQTVGLFAIPGKPLSSALPLAIGASTSFGITCMVIALMLRELYPQTAKVLYGVALGCNLLVAFLMDAHFGRKSWFVMIPVVSVVLVGYFIECRRMGQPTHV